MYNTTKPYKLKILSAIKATWQTPYVSVKSGLVHKKFSYPEYHHSDGIGTKGIYHWRKRSFKNAVLDALAMNLNDLAMVGATPYAITDHLFLPEDDEAAILEIIKTLAALCKKRKIAITGGETAIHEEDHGLEISLTMLGFVPKPSVNCLKIGNKIIGFESNGLHSNGFTRVRELFPQKFRPEFIVPTRIYLEIITALRKKFAIHAAIHITGGAFTKLKDILPKNCDVLISDEHSLKPQAIFGEVYKMGVSDAEMYKTFNCGIGFIIGVAPEDSKKVLKDIKTFKADIIGEVVVGRGRVQIKSKFKGKTVIF